MCTHVHPWFYTYVPGHDNQPLTHGAKSLELNSPGSPYRCIEIAGVDLSLVPIGVKNEQRPAFGPRAHWPTRLVARAMRIGWLAGAVRLPMQRPRSRDVIGHAWPRNKSKGLMGGWRNLRLLLTLSRSTIRSNASSVTQKAKCIGPPPSCRPCPSS